MRKQEVTEAKDSSIQGGLATGRFILERSQREFLKKRRKTVVMPGTLCHIGASWSLLDDMIMNISRVPELTVEAAILVPNSNVYFVFKNLLPRYLVIFP